MWLIATCLLSCQKLDSYIPLKFGLEAKNIVENKSEILWRE